MYCQKVTGDNDFDIDEWNKAYNECIELGIPFPKEDTTECKNQCKDCAEIVLARQKLTQQLINKQKL